MCRKWIIKLAYSSRYIKVIDRLTFRAVLSFYVYCRLLNCFLTAGCYHTFKAIHIKTETETNPFQMTKSNKTGEPWTDKRYKLENSEIRRNYRTENLSTSRGKYLLLYLCTSVYFICKSVFVFLQYDMGYHIQDDFQSHLVQSMIKLGPHTLYMNRLLVFGSRALGPWDPTFGSYNNTRCWLMQRLFCSDIGHYTREDTNPVFPVVQESQFSSAIGESNKLVLNIILVIFTSVMVCRNTFLDD